MVVSAKMTVYMKMMLMMLTRVEKLIMKSIRWKSSDEMKLMEVEKTRKLTKLM